MARRTQAITTIEVQGGGNWELFDELFADDFHDYTPQPGGKPDKTGVLGSQQLPPRCAAADLPPVVAMPYFSWGK